MQTAKKIRLPTLRRVQLAFFILISTLRALDSRFNVPRDRAAIEIKILGLVLVVVLIVVFAGSVFISLWANSAGFANIGTQIANAIASPIIAFFSGLAGIITHYLNPANW